MSAPVYLSYVTTIRALIQYPLSEATINSVRHYDQKLNRTLTIYVLGSPGTAVLNWNNSPSATPPT